MKDYTKLFARCANRVIPALPKTGESDCLHRLITKDDIGMRDALCGQTTTSLAIWDAAAMPQHGYSMNHSVLTTGIVAHIQSRMMRENGEPTKLDGIISKEQMAFLIRESLYALPAWYGAWETTVYLDAGYQPPVFYLFGMNCHVDDDLPRFNLRYSDFGPTFYFRMYDSGENGYADAKYTCTFIIGPTRERSWFIIHRIPYYCDGLGRLDSGRNHMEPWGLFCEGPMP